MYLRFQHVPDADLNKCDCIHRLTKEINHDLISAPKLLKTTNRAKSGKFEDDEYL